MNNKYEDARALLEDLGELSLGISYASDWSDHAAGQLDFAIERIEFYCNQLKQIRSNINTGNSENVS